MRRPDYSDIPEVFRRAFENDDPQRQGGGQGGDPPPAQPTSGQKPWWQNRNTWLIAILLIVFLSFNWFVSTYIDWLWFSERGYFSVWTTQLITRWATFGVFFVVAAFVLLVSWHVNRRAASKLTVPFFTGPATITLEPVRWLINIAGLFLSFTFASAAATQWESILLYFNRVPFNDQDPIFGLDISFFMFELPVYRFIQGWFMPLIIFAVLGIVAIYALRLLPTLQSQGFQLRDIPTSLRRALAIMGAIFFAFWAVGYWLDTYELVYSARGVVYGASYTDINASLYALYIQMAAAIILSVAMLINYFRFELRPLAGAGILWLVATVIVGGIYPLILQRFIVIPNEIAVESPYIRYNIDYTRKAFGLDRITERQFGRVDELALEDLSENEAALNNVRLWDYRPLQATYSQLQELRPYYQFIEVDIDRYMINGEERQVMLAPRELDKARLPSATWVNEKLIFTHGYGIVMNPVDRFTSQGRPEFFISDLPPVSTVDIEITRPEIYYGEAADDIVFVGSAQDEFSYADENQDVYSNYAGTGGVALSNTFRRLAFAYQFGESNLLFSDSVTPDTRAMFNRQIQERVRKITPFLLLDGDPYIVITDGRLVWIQDAYTFSNQYPYSEPVQLNGGLQINYIRNNIKIVIDAYNGEVDYYKIDSPSDPLTNAYDRAFPGLFQPFEEMPEGLKRHVRYPELLFRIQTNQYLTYHMTDVQVFYNKEDLRAIPQEIFDGLPQQMDPYYVMFRLPGEEETEYLLIQPYTPAEKRNMIAWIAARNDPEHYGELVAYEFPPQSLVVGPIQIEGFIDQEPEISQQFSLWDQRGSRIIRGNLIVIPLNDSFLYVEPIYLESETSALPELKRVIVASGERIVMRETLSEALSALLTGEGTELVVEDVVDDIEAAVEESTEGTEVTEETDPDTVVVTPVSVDGTLDELIQQANDQFQAAEAAQQAGDWAEYGRQIEALEQTLRQLESFAP
ncbi:MAG: UPF0182 family protein [Ardenticatenaceae bacterium]|nr:UPF0182 family protein [Ardenticatenaceae bacterium]